jgi:arsenate reductase
MPPRATRTLNILFLCTGNSARSILAEALVNAIAPGRLRAYSAGSRPAGGVHPLALEALERNAVRVEGLRSKPFSEFLADGAPKMDFVITLCDSAQQECPVWPGHSIRAHWAIDDPVAAPGEEARRAFAQAFGDLQDRLLVLASMPLDKLERPVLERRLHEIGQLGTPGDPTGPTHLADRIRAASRPLRRGLLPRVASR